MHKRYYCFPDIHGMYSLLSQALDYVYAKNPDGGKIIFLGDYIDRGPENRKVLDTVMNPPKGWEFICLKGNHEEMLADIGQPYDPNVPKEYYGNPVAYKEAKEWMKNLKLIHVEHPNLFVHAFYDTTFSMELQRKHTLLWHRVPDNFPFIHEELFLTHGHTPRTYGPVRAENRINMDIGSFKGQYAIAEYEQGVKGPVDIKKFINEDVLYDFD